jgi:hypothetical protein
LTAAFPIWHVRGKGARPVGWSGPDFQETPNTPNLLAAEGIRHVCDWGNDEQPYRMTPKSLVAAIRGPSRIG